jgi:hypothetical protein
MVIAAAAAHAEFVEKGREPGKFPPPDAILGWVKRKGLGASAFSIKSRRAIGTGTRRTFNRAAGRRRTAAQSLLQAQKSIAYLVGRKIARKGIKANPLVTNVKQDYASEISATMTSLRLIVARYLNR